MFNYYPYIAFCIEQANRYISLAKRQEYWDEQSYHTWIGYFHLGLGLNFSEVTRKTSSRERNNWYTRGKTGIVSC